MKLGEDIRRDPNPHRIVRRAEKLDLADSGNTGELVLNIDRDVVREKSLVPGPVRRTDREHQQRNSDGLLGREAVVAHSARQARGRLREAVLHLHLIEVNVGADCEADLQGHRAVVVVDRLHVEHVLRAVHLPLDRSGDRLLDCECVRAGICSRRLNLRRNDIRKLGDREPKDHHGARDHEKDRDNHRDDGPVDEEPRHRASSGCRGLRRPRALGRLTSGDSAGAGSRTHRLRINFHPVANLLQSVGDDAFAGRDSLLDDLKATRLLADLDGAHRHLVVRAHDGDLVLPLGLEHGVLRNEQRVVPDLGGSADFRIHAGAQNMARIRKDPLNFDRAGLDLDLPIHIVNVTRILVGAPVRKDHFELWRVVSARVLVNSIGEVKIDLLADREFDLDRIELGDGRQAA